METIEGNQVQQSVGKRLQAYLAKQPAWLKIGAIVIGIYLLAAIPIMILDLT